MTAEWIIAYTALGAITGFLAGLLGIGGGGIVVPLLASMLAVQGIGDDKVVHIAMGTALTCMIVTASASLRAHAKRGSVEWRIAAIMAPSIMLGTFMMSAVAAKLQASWISWFFAVFMLLVAIKMYFNLQLPIGKHPMTNQGLFIVALSIGAISALAAVGGGFLTVSYLSYHNIVMKRAIGTSAAVGLPIAIAGTAGYMANGWSITKDIPLTLGFVYLPAFIAISVASIVMAPLGSRLTQRLPEKWLRRIFALISLALSAKMLISFT